MGACSGAQVLHRRAEDKFVSDLYVSMQEWASKQPLLHTCGHVTTACSVARLWIEELPGRTVALSLECVHRACAW